MHQSRKQNSIAMRNLKQSLIILFFSSSVISCNDEGSDLTDNLKSLIVGEWNVYESGSKKTGIHPGILSGLTLLYEHGISFSDDGKFGPRYYFNGVWTGGGEAGTYEVRNDRTVILVFSPGTKDESKLELKLLKLDKEHLWFEHSFYVNDQNPEPAEHHLKKVK
jgi:hypothetical protein